MAHRTADEAADKPHGPALEAAFAATHCATLASTFGPALEATHRSAIWSPNGAAIAAANESADKAAF